MAQPLLKIWKTLKVEVSVGPKKKVFDLEPVFRDPGHCNAPFFSTIQTTYQYRLTGIINNTPVDLPFTCTTCLLKDKQEIILLSKFLMA